MANKRLKSIQFPNLSDKYTIPEVDETLSLQGEAADAKKTGDDIRKLRSDLDNVKPLSDNVKNALLNCFSHVAWLNENGQDYFVDLEAAMYGESVSDLIVSFNPGTAVIYTDNSLDSLKQYLTVTAYFADESSREVSDYTLSGTLTVPTSTVTVSYRGKTSDFTVSVGENLFNPNDLAMRGSIYVAASGGGGAIYNNQAFCQSGAIDTIPGEELELIAQMNGTTDFWVAVLTTGDATDVNNVSYCYRIYPSGTTDGTLSYAKITVPQDAEWMSFQSLIRSNMSLIKIYRTTTPQE